MTNRMYIFIVQLTIVAIVV